jgi:hypothetical protein
LYTTSLSNATQHHQVCSDFNYQFLELYIQLKGKKIKFVLRQIRLHEALRRPSFEREARNSDRQRTIAQSCHQSSQERTGNVSKVSFFKSPFFWFFYLPKQILLPFLCNVFKILLFFWPLCCLV